MGLKLVSIVFCLAAVVVFPIHAQVTSTSQPLNPLESEQAEQSSLIPEEPPAATGSESLQPFGYQLFKDIMSSDFTQMGGPMPSDYRLGAGDRIGIHLGGKVQQQYEAVVSADGQIFVPTLGLFIISDMTMAQLRDALHKRLERLYSDYSLDLMLISAKLISVSVVGEVNRPGHYVISAFSTVLDAIAKAQGTTDRGSLRDIQVYRGDSLKMRVDLYDFLLKPGSGTNSLLQSGDKIFVSLCKSLVILTGAVYRPAVYELSPEQTERITDIIDLAGGLTDLAFAEKIELSRMQKNEQRKVFYFNYEKARQDSTFNLTLQNNDVINVFSWVKQVPRQVVTIFGQVAKPGEYGFETNLHLSDLILKADGLTRSAYLLQAQVAKIEPQLSARVIEVDLAKLLYEKDILQDVLLEADDQVFIRQIPGWRVGPLVELHGEFVFPGFYPIVADSTTLFEILNEAGGFTKDAFISEAKVIRKRQSGVVDKEFERLKNMMRDEMSDQEYEYFVMKENTADVNEVLVDFTQLFIKGDRSQDIVLMDGDVIMVPKKPRVVMVTGRVGKPGGVLFKEGMNLKYYINKAGGFTWDADGGRTKIIMSTGETKDDEDVAIFSPGDRIWVPRKPDRNYWQIFRDTIMVLGQLAAVYLVIQNASK